jgi:hypothetical protein
MVAELAPRRFFYRMPMEKRGCIATALRIVSKPAHLGGFLSCP